MNFKFKSHGKIIYGMPYIAKLYVDMDMNLKRNFIECNAIISKDGDVEIETEYEANNFDIIEQRDGSFGPDTISTYNIAYRNKLIMLGEVSDLDLENKIIDFLIGNCNINILLESIDDLIKEKFEEEIQEILNKEREKVFTNKSNKDYINIVSAIKKFLEDNKSIISQFNDFHVIFESECEEIIMKFINDENIYVETKSFKVNIMLDKIQSYQAINSKYNYSQINILMTDGATITLIKSN